MRCQINFTAFLVEEGFLRSFALIWEMANDILLQTMPYIMNVNISIKSLLEMYIHLSSSVFCSLHLKICFLFNGKLCMYRTIFLAKTNHFKYTERLQSHLKNCNGIIITCSTSSFHPKKQLFYHSAGIWYNLLRGLSKVAVILNVSLVLSCCVFPIGKWKCAFLKRTLLKNDKFGQNCLVKTTLI